MAMTRLQWLLTKVAEEVGELAKEALKAQQFGMESSAGEFTNLESMQLEFNDLLGALRLVIEEINQPAIYADPDLVVATTNKIKAEQQAAVLEAKLESEKSISDDLKLRLSTTETASKQFKTETRQSKLEFKTTDENNKTIIENILKHSQIIGQWKAEYNGKIILFKKNNKV